MAEKKKNDSPWYFNPWVITGAILGFGAFGLILLWMRPATRLGVKILVSIVVIGATVLLTMQCLTMYRVCILHYKELAGIVGG